MPDHEHERPDPDQPGVVHVGIAGPVATSGGEAPEPPAPWIDDHEVPVENVFFGAAPPPPDDEKG